MSNASAGATSPPVSISFRIFLASPSDVAYERQIAREVIDQLRSERRFRARISIDLVAWDQPGAGVAMEAGVTPQEAIAQGLPKPDECDLLIVILWSRIGTPLPTQYTKPDGGRYLSGTEWEYCNGVESYQRCGKPGVWVYHRTEVPSVALDDAARQDKLEQWEALKGFLGAFTNPDGSQSGGHNAYETPEEFRRQLEQHLRDRLDLLLEQNPSSGAGAIVEDAMQDSQPARWTGVPYPGLEAFTPAQAPIFFGASFISYRE